MGRKSKEIVKEKAEKVPQNCIGQDGDGQGLSSDEMAKKFGPCHVEAQQARTAILLLQSPEPNVILASLNCLQKFCKKRDENKKLFIEMNGLIEAIKLIFHENQLIQRCALKLIAITSSFHEAALQLRDLDVAQDLITLAGLNDDAVVEYSTFTLSSLAMLFTGRLQIVQNAGVQVLIHLLSNEDPDIQKNCAETIWRMLEEPLNVDLITSKGSIEPFLKLINAEYPALQIVALSILEKVSTRDAGVQVLDSIEAYKQLGEKLAVPEYGDLHRTILRTLTNMCFNQSARQKIVPLVPIVARILDTSPDLMSQVHALGLLGLLSSVPVVSKALVDFGMCKRLIKILSSNPEIKMKEAASYCMSQLAQTDVRVKEELVDAIQPLLNLIQQNISTAGFEYTMMAFTSILEDGHKACPTFVNCGGLCVFRKLLEDKDKYSEDGILSLMSSISLLGSNWNLRIYCVDAGLVLGILKTLKSSENPQFLTAAANGIYGLLCNEIGRKQFLENDGYAVLAKLISHEEFPVVVSVVPILHILGTYKDINKELIEKGILQVIWKRQDLISKNGPLRTAFECLISTNLPAKYAMSGHIDPFEKLSHGFYDIGNLRSNDCFLTLNQMTWEKREPQRQVLYLNWDSTIDDKIAVSNNKSLQVVQSEKQNCQSLVEVVKQQISQINSEKALVKAIAKAVSDRMGGVLDKWRLSAQTEDLEVADLQTKYESVVVPISMISNGAFRCRAILFKALCDVFGIPCSIERGEYKRMWNVVMLQSKKPQKPACPCGDYEVSKSLVYTEKLRRFVVDLVYQPGALLAVNSYDANTYCFV